MLILPQYCDYFGMLECDKIASGLIPSKMRFDCQSGMCFVYNIVTNIACQFCHSFCMLSL
ncbi:hypothetical protein HWD31_gp04 [Pantoea phage vB_PagM_SSEM1]|uniref:Uncharacterized protein n=1 Tax=Pantoea phage vB_PagM_SSEM1 TaxID=2721760 RepID=A0A6H0D9V5_9CAUD|nr:hypothetical protein HWD31_gp04 [Pantoea phage vB_PagM_SSEM1]QIS79370.1 hypothetical protein SSEM1_gp04 [Pantoea phage vB_PagM_SSEM1]